jgi:hypothetical protein
LACCALINGQGQATHWRYPALFRARLIVDSEASTLHTARTWAMLWAQVIKFFERYRIIRRTLRLDNLFGLYLRPLRVRLEPFSLRIREMVGSGIQVMRNISQGRCPALKSP